MRLYEIAEGLRAALEAVDVDVETGEVTGLDAVEALQENADAKLEGCAVVLKEMRADIDALKAEETALKARRTAAERRFESLRSFGAASL